MLDTGRDRLSGSDLFAGRRTPGVAPVVLSMVEQRLDGCPCGLACGGVVEGDSPRAASKMNAARRLRVKHRGPLVGCRRMRH